MAGEETVRVAVDVEGVLVNNNAPFMEDYNEFFGLSGSDAFGVEDINEWGFGRVFDYFEAHYSEEGYGVDEFFNGMPEEGGFPGYTDIIQTAWMEEQDRLLPTEPDLAGGMNYLHDVLEQEYGDYVVDIVTARKHVDEYIQDWLQEQGIEAGEQYDRFVVKEDKPALHYDWYLDDRPGMHEELEAGETQLRYRQPWNEDYDAQDERVEEVESMREAADTIAVT